MNAQELASELISNGYMPVPIPAGTKAIRTKDWPTLTFTPESFKAGNNVGIRCGDGGLAFMDIDVYCPETAGAIAAEWTRRFPSDNWMRRTGQAPKTGFLFRLPSPRKKISVTINPTGFAPEGKEDGVEMLGEGQQFVAFGVHPDTKEPYKWHGANPTQLFYGISDLPLVTAEQVHEFMDWVTSTYGTPKPAKKLSERAAAAMPTPSGVHTTLDGFGAPSADEVAELLGHINPDIEHDAWVAVLMGLHDLGDHMLPLAIEWSAKGSKFVPGDVEARWASFTKGDGVTWKTVPAMAREAGADLKLITIRHSKKRASNDSTFGATKAKPRAARVSNGETDGGADEMPDFPDWKVSAKDVPLAPRSTRRNLEALIDWAGIDVRYDVYSRRIIAWHNGKEITAHVDAAVLDLAARHDLPKSAVLEQIDAVAYDREINKPLIWLGQLPKPDGDPLADWLYQSKILFEEVWPREEVHEAWEYIIWSKFFIAACAAADQLQRTPNKEAVHKFEQIVVIVSTQGKKKSTAIMQLLPPELRDYFGGGVSLHLGQKDSLIEATSYWIAELGELDATFRKSDIAALKAFLSRGRDDIRMPYDRRARSYPRRTVYFASVNQREFLQDTTGNRRYLPIEIYKPLVYSTELGKGIFGQAWHRYLGGESWWLSNEEEAIARGIQQDFDANPYIQAIVENFDVQSDTRNFRIKPGVILEALGLRGEQIGRARNALKSALEHFGIQKAEGSARESRYYNMPPASEEFLRKYRAIMGEDR